MGRDQTGNPDLPPPFDTDVDSDPNSDVGGTPRNPREFAERNPGGFTPFQIEADFSLRRGEGSAEAALPPAGNEHQIVIIEHVTVAASIPRDQGIVAYVKVGEIKHTLVLTLQQGWSNPQLFRASQPIKLYSTGGGEGIAFAGVERSRSTGSASIHFTASGYLVDSL